jgi:hypothetical protein
MGPVLLLVVVVDDETAGVLCPCVAAIDKRGIVLLAYSFVGWVLRLTWTVAARVICLHLH